MNLSERFEEALVWACQLHRSQRRKGTPVPYVAHLLGVTSIVLQYGGDEDEAIAALLHDAVEDQGGEPVLREIERRFGGSVAAIVAGCTDTMTQPKPPWRERKGAYLAHLPHASASVRRVSAADKLHNVRAIIADYRLLGEDLWSRLTGGRDGTLWYYQALVDAFRAAGSDPLIEELARTVAEMECLAAQGVS
jgi:GTP pyrophosphokinase